MMVNRILFFTIHRSGSMFTHRVCRDLTRLCNMTYYSPNGGDVPVSVREMAQNAAFWHGKRGCFGPLRIFMDVPDREHDQVILHLRDPRDVLISMYYSYCYSHPGEIPGFTGYRRDIAERGIDDFVLKLATSKTRPVIGDYGTGAHLWDLTGNVLQRYQLYVSRLLNDPKVLLVTYEEMVTDLAGWLEKVLDAFDIEDREKVLLRLIEYYQSDLWPPRENEWSHKRHVIPGDYKNRLSRETVEKLNHIFADVLQCLGYQDIE